MRIPFFLLVAFFPLFSFSQNGPQARFAAGVDAGLTFSQVDGDTYSGFTKVGFSAGFIATLPVTGNFFGSMEILYAEKGSLAFMSPTNPYYWKLRLNYADVPVLINYQDPNANLSFGAGLSFGTLVKSTLTDYDANGRTYSTVASLHKFDLEGVVNVSYGVTNNLYLNARFSYSIIPIGTNLTTRGFLRMYNNGLGASVRYLFER